MKANGVKHMNFTVYGTEAYHDRFAGRKGDHAYLLRMMESAAKIGLQVSVGVPLTKENVAQVDELLHILGAHGGEDVHLLAPTGRGEARSWRASAFRWRTFPRSASMQETN